MNRDCVLSLPSANEFNLYLDNALANHEIGKNDWCELNKLYFTKLYLSSDNPERSRGTAAMHFTTAFPCCRFLRPYTVTAPFWTWAARTDT